MNSFSLLCFLAVSCVVASRAASVVVPNANAIVEGNSDNVAPFGLLGTNSSMRYQQVYDASQFSQVPNGGLITEIFLHIDELATTGFDATLSNIQINLSTTSKTPDSLSPIFSANVGADDTVVLGPASLRLSDLDLGINFSTPFRYNPAAGNLLLDVRNYQGINFTAGVLVAPFDAQNRINDPVSRIYADSVGALTATRLDSLGLVTIFEITPVPEPFSLWLLLMGSSVLGIFVLHKGKQLTGCFPASDE